MKNRFTLHAWRCVGIPYNKIKGNPSHLCNGLKSCHEKYAIIFDKIFCVLSPFANAITVQSKKKYSKFPKNVVSVGESAPVGVRIHILLLIIWQALSYKTHKPTYITLKSVGKFRISPMVHTNGYLDKVKIRQNSDSIRSEHNYD